MNEHERPGHPAFDRLVAADPAKHLPDPVQGVLRAKVDALIAEQAGDEPQVRTGQAERRQAERAQADEHARTDELAVRRHRRRTPWLVAAAVAGIVAVGGGGYLVGESGADVTPAAMDVRNGAEPGETRSGGPTGSGEDAPTVLGQPDGAVPEQPQPLGANDELPSATGRVFHAGVGLSRASGTAEVRAVGPGGETLGEYPVVSEVEAVERLGDPRFAGAVGSRQARPGEEGSADGGAPAPGGSIVWPVEDVTIVSATLTEVRYTLPDGAVLLVPAYDLSDAEGNSWTVMAVDEEQLDFTP